MPELLVNKPQFDTAKLRPGKALRVSSKDRNDWYGFNYDCLIVEAAPLELQLAYVKERKGDIEDDERGSYYSVEKKTLPIDLVASGTVTIELLNTEGGK